MTAESSNDIKPEQGPCVNQTSTEEAFYGMSAGCGAAINCKLEGNPKITAYLEHNTS